MLIEPNWKDEILEDDPKYRINSNGNIIIDNSSIEQITPVIQVPTPLNKANLQVPIGEIKFFSTSRNDSKYLLCNGARIEKADYPLLINTLSEKYVYEAKPISTLYRTITQIQYFPEQNIYIMVRVGDGTTVGFTIWTSRDGENWGLRYTSDLAYYNTPVQIRYYSGFNCFIGFSNKMFIKSPDGLNWNIFISELPTSAYSYTEPTYVESLEKYFWVRYKPNSAYYSCVQSTSDLSTVTNGHLSPTSISQIYRTKIIEHNNALYTSTLFGTNVNADYSSLYKSIDNGATFSSIALSLNTNNCIKFGNYFYYHTYTGTTPAIRGIYKTSNFSACEALISSARNVAILGIIENHLYITYNDTLMKIDVENNITYFPYTDNLQYLSSRNTFIKISDSIVLSSTDLVNWEQYDYIGSNNEITKLFYANNKLFAIKSETQTSEYYFYDEKYINLPTFENVYAYIKAQNESEDD